LRQELLRFCKHNQAGQEQDCGQDNPDEQFRFGVADDDGEAHKPAKPGSTHETEGQRSVARYRSKHFPFGLHADDEQETNHHHIRKRPRSVEGAPDAKKKWLWHTKAWGNGIGRMKAIQPVGVPVRRNSILIQAINAHDQNTKEE
jgi:hypothetical protein